MNQIQQLAKSLITQLNTSTELRNTAHTLEKLSSNETFKQHAYDIAASDLTDQQKTNQLLSLVKTIEIPQLQQFFHELFSQGQFWVFASQQFDFFDEFVKSFQLEADQLAIIYMATAIDLDEQFLTHISAEFSQLLNKHAIISHQVNPDMIAGAQVRIENLIFDYSAKAKLTQFENKWIASVSEHTQRLSPN